MDQIGVARHGVSCYWFDFYDNDSIGTCNYYPADGCERLEDFINNPHADHDPVQGVYRSMEGKDGKGPTPYYVGGVSHTNILSGYNENLDNLYLNFYLRRRTETSGIAVSLSCTHTATAEMSDLYSYINPIDWDGWELNYLRLKAEGFIFG